KVADVEGGSGSNGANICQWDYHGGANQQWIIEPVDGGYYKIINAKTGKSIDVEARSTADNANVLQWDYQGGWNQQWSIIPV
ncbi:MAG: RICIN domain-containing protein, partial [Ruminiclostridium sp.]